MSRITRIFTDKQLKNFSTKEKYTDWQQAALSRHNIIWKTVSRDLGDNYQNVFFCAQRRSMLYEKETYEIIGICMEVHGILGHGFSEIVYKDALEIEFQNRNIEYKREKEYSIAYKGKFLRHKFYADFIVFDKIVLEAKAVNDVFDKNDLKQSINYLKVSGCRIGLMINFGLSKLLHQRLIF